MTDHTAHLQGIRVHHLAAFMLATGAGCRDSAVLGTDLPGPPCACDSYFSTCVGAEWTYDVKDALTGAVTPKTFSIVDWADPDRPEYDLTGFSAFRQLRVTDTDSKDSWLVRSADGLRLIWLFDEWFDPNGRRTRTMYFAPGKLRLDETPEHLVPGACWREQFTEHRIEMGNEELFEHQSDWCTLPPEDHGPFSGTLCQRKLDTITGQATPIDATFCFARGVGKVYENTSLVNVENLVDWSIPGCPR